MKTPKTRRILGYSRISHKGGDGEIITHHINDVCNTLCVARHETTAIYVIEWNEEQDSDTRQHAGTRGDAPY